MVDHAIDETGGMKGRGNHINAGGFELAMVIGSGRDVWTKKESVVTASGTLDEGIDGSTERGTPEMIGLLIVPIGDEQTRDSTEEHTEIGIGVKKPFAGKSGIGNAGLARAVAGLEVLGARFEGQNLDSKGKPEEGGCEASLASE